MAGVGQNTAKSALQECTTASTTVAVGPQTQTQIDSFTFLRQQIVAGSLGNRTKVEKVKKRRKEELVVKYTD